MKLVLRARWSCWPRWSAASAGPTGTFQEGSNVGDMLLWDGNAWVEIPIGEEEDLTVCDGETFIGDLVLRQLWKWAWHIKGVIVYLDGNGGGLIVATTDTSIGTSWGCEGTNINGTSCGWCWTYEYRSYLRGMK
ncbi:MAG: hypothetical protein R2809_14855 [Flavobacteriales bacterium]